MHQSPLLREILQQPGANQKTLNGKLRFMERDGQLPLYWEIRSGLPQLMRMGKKCMQSVSVKNPERSGSETLSNTNIFLSI